MQAVILGWQGAEGASYELWRNGQMIAELTAPGYVDTAHDRVNQYLLVLRLPGAEEQVDMTFMILECEPINTYLVEDVPFLLVGIRQECVEDYLPVN